MTLHFLIDCNPGIDDALTLTYAFAHPQVAVEGLVASGGNVSTEQVGRNVRGLLDLLGGQLDSPSWEQLPYSPCSCWITRCAGSYRRHP